MTMITSGLVLHYKLDEGTGNIVIDYSGYNNSGIISGATWYISGKINNCLNFDGTDDRVTCSGSVVNLTTANTLAVWINPNKVSGTQHIISRWDATNNKRSYALTQQNNGFHYNLSTDGITNAVNLMTSEANIGTWYHVAGTYDNNNVVLYLNGVVIASNTFSSSLYSTPTLVTVIGSRPDGGTFVDGLLDDVRIYNRALTANEIQNLYLINNCNPFIDSQSWIYVTPSLSIDSQTQIYLRNPAEIITRILNDNWNINTATLPSISTQMNPSKRLNYRDTNWIIIDTQDSPEKYVGLFRDFINSETKIKMRIGTTSYGQLHTIFDEVKRILYSKRRAVGYDDYLIIGDIKKTDLSNVKRKIFMLDIEFEIKEIVKSVA